MPPISSPASISAFACSTILRLPPISPSATSARYSSSSSSSFSLFLLSPVLFRSDRNGKLFQEKVALIFCLEDRAVLCRDCDVSIHASNTLAANHRRFLSTGIRVSLHAEQQGSVNVSQDKPHDNVTPPPPPSQVIKKHLVSPTEKESIQSSSSSSSPFQSTQSSVSALKSDSSDPRVIKPSSNKPPKRTSIHQCEHVPTFQTQKKPEDWQDVNLLELGMGYPVGDATLSKVK